MNVAEITSAPSPFGLGNIQVCRRGCKANILLVALSRHATRNAFNDDLYNDLINVLQLAASDDSLSAIVLTGSGEYFSSGADLKNGQFEPRSNGRNTLTEEPSGRFMAELLRFPKVIVAAVQGPAVGIGVTLLMHCDLVWCSSKATFWVPFTRLALVPELCSSVTFIESMGLSKANELLLLGRKIDAQTAVNWNICSRMIVDDDQSGDPFARRSLANMMADELDKKLFSLPLGDKTSEYFCELIRGQRRRRMEQVCRLELEKLDERFDSGQVQEAASQLKIGSSRRTPRSRL
ncbi:dodecenoyl-CoA isomerase [Mayamaea pseudoterrestris]|nr:dodecenoyl-CoA isomerase [Mayamaea pseudoterrestris]